MTRQTSQKLPAPEANLLDYVRRLERFRAGRRALHLHLSRLRPYNRRSHHLRVATSTCDNLVRYFDGALFTLGDDDMVLICRDAPDSQIDDCVTRLRFLFSEDPLLYGDEEGDRAFCTRYDLERDYTVFLELAGDLARARARRDEALAAAPMTKPEAAAKPGPPVGTAKMAALEAAIVRADLSSLVQRQAICSLEAGAAPAPLFHEVRFSIDGLGQMLMPGHDLRANPWLFRNLTRRLDRHMIALLIETEDRYRNQSFSLNMNLETLLAPDFLRLDAALRGYGRTIIVELAAVDVFADVGRFDFARDFLHDHGYRLCLDGMTHHALPNVDWEAMGFDLVKLHWSEQLRDPQMGLRDEEQRAALRSLPARRIILDRSDSPAALETGLSLGISLFQGFAVDHLLARDPVQIGLSKLGHGKARRERGAGRP